MYNKIFELAKKPELYAPGNAKFWDDEHISKGMLESHLDPDWESATRRHEYVDKSVAWIASILPREQYPRLIDFGCGPGLYAERFHQKGYAVTGVDISPRSLQYATNSAAEKGYDITYIQHNYLTLKLEQTYDIAMIVNFDFGVLSDADRKIFLRNAYNSLRKGGRFIVDVFTPPHLSERNIHEYTKWGHHDSCFLCNKPHICLEATHIYPRNIYVSQTIMITEEDVRSIHIWERLFTKEEIIAELTEAGFTSVALYNDSDGTPYTHDTSSICAVATK